MMNKKEKLNRLCGYLLKNFILEESVFIKQKVKAVWKRFLQLRYYVSDDIYYLVSLTDYGINIIRRGGLEEDELQHFVSLKKYEDENERKKYLDYNSELWVLYYHTDYLDNLPKAYTFLLSSSLTKTFCRDISKLIAYKILFFIFSKTKNKILCQMMDIGYT